MKTLNKTPVGRQWASAAGLDSIDWRGERISDDDDDDVFYLFLQKQKIAPPEAPPKASHLSSCTPWPLTPANIDKYFVMFKFDKYFVMTIYGVLNRDATLSKTGPSATRRI